MHRYIGRYPYVHDNWTASHGGCCGWPRPYFAPRGLVLPRMRHTYHTYPGRPRVMSRLTPSSTSPPTRIAAASSFLYSPLSIIHCPIAIPFIDPKDPPYHNLYRPVAIPAWQRFANGLARKRPCTVGTSTHRNRSKRREPISRVMLPWQRE